MINNVNWCVLRLTGPQTQDGIAELLIKLGEELKEAGC
jgi:hypothetical protein